MTEVTKPAVRPARPFFSSGPCAKRPGWTPEALKDAAVGRSHRSKLGKKKIVEAVDRTRAVLGIPADYRIAIVPASDTGAVEMALWSLLGARPVDMLTWESFGEGWVDRSRRRPRQFARASPRQGLPLQSPGWPPARADGASARACAGGDLRRRAAAAGR